MIIFSNVFWVKSCLQLFINIVHLRFKLTLKLMFGLRIKYFYFRQFIEIDSISGQLKSGSLLVKTSIVVQNKAINQTLYKAN